VFISLFYATEFVVIDPEFCDIFVYTDDPIGLAHMGTLQELHRVRILVLCFVFYDTPPPKIIFTRYRPE
jgi:hypothetical protein